MTLPPIAGTAVAQWQRFRALNAAGRRREAAEALAVFTASLAPDDRVRFTGWFCRDRYLAGGRVGMRSHLMPLARDVLVPTLLAGAQRGESDSLRWLVHARMDYPMRLDVLVPELVDNSRPAGLLAAALARNPIAPDVWRAVFHYEFAPAEWGAHHLGEGKLILPVDECLAAIQRARRVLAGSPAGALSADDRRDVDMTESAVNDYIAWKAEPLGESFTAWCQRHDRDYRWPVPVYYDR